MREFSTTANKALANGLQPNESFRDTQFFRELLNLVPYENSLRPYEPVTDILGLEHQKELYPFPQWFRFENDNLVLLNHDLNVVDDSYTPFNIQQERKAEWKIGQFTEPFRGVDYGDAWILLNRDGVIYKRFGKIYSLPTLRASALAEHRNRTLIGGALQGFWTDEWLYEIADLTDEIFEDNFDFTVPLGKNFVFWSDLGSEYFPFSLLHPEMLLNDFSPDSRFIDLLYANEFGFIEMPFTGAVLDIIPSGQQVYVFGENGLATMAMEADSPGAGFVITGQQPFGIKSRGAAGGSEESIVFIDAENNLWYGDNRGIQKLDYRDYMAELTGQIYIHRDPDQNQFYIGDENTSFVLNDMKLARVHQTIMQIDGGYSFKAGVVYETGAQSAIIETEGLDIGIPGLKTLTGIHISADQPFKAKARAIAEITGKEVKTPYFIVNHEGYAATRLFGKNHRIQIIFENYKNLHIDGIELKWQTDDARQRRGFFATQDATGAG